MAVTGTAESGAARIERSTETWIIVVGLTLGWTLGFAGNFLPEGPLKLTLWVVSSMGIMAGTAVLAVRHVAHNVMLSAGLALILVGEAVIHSQGPSGVDAFASATYAYFPGLLLVALSGWGPVWARATALGSGLAFGAHAFMHVLGYAPPTNGPVTGTGYGLLMLTMIGWTWAVLRRPGRRSWQ